MKILHVYATADFSTSDVSNGYQTALVELGHDVKPFRTNNRIDFWAESLSHWAKVTQQDKPVHPVQVLREASMQVLIEAALFRPELVLVTSAMGVHPDACHLLRTLGFPVAAVFTECPYDDEHHLEFAKVCDWVFANDRISVPVLRASNPNTYYLGTAYNPAVHKPVPPLEQAQVLFVGTGFKERGEFLAQIDWSGIDLQLFGFWDWGEAPLPPSLRPFLRGPSLEGTEASKGLPAPIDNEEAIRRYCGADICLNFYRQGYGESINPRAYELAACGVFQLAQDAVPEAHEVFGDSIAYFSTPQELEAKVHYYLARPEERLRMAQEARRRVGPHNYLERARELLRAVSGDAGMASLTAGQPLDRGSPVARITP